jgi:hypothetical protein
VGSREPIASTTARAVVLLELTGTPSIAAMSTPRPR